MDKQQAFAKGILAWHAKHVAAERPQYDDPMRGYFDQGVAHAIKRDKRVRKCSKQGSAPRIKQVEKPSLKIVGALIIGLIYAPFMIVLMPWLLLVSILTVLVEFLKDGTLPSCRTQLEFTLAKARQKACQHQNDQLTEHKE